jgi:hypothetical protein
LWVGLESMGGGSQKWQCLARCWGIRLRRVFMRSWRSLRGRLRGRLRSSSWRRPVLLRMGCLSMRPRRLC